MKAATEIDVAVAKGADALEAVAVASERLIELSIDLGRRSEVRRSVQGIDCRRLRSGSVLSMYVECELQSTNVLCWWLEVGWRERWTIASRIYLNHDDGQDVVREFPERRAEDAAGFIAELGAAVDELAASVADVDLTRC